MLPVSLRRLSAGRDSHPDFQVGAEIDGDFDLRQQSTAGCIPPLLEMGRPERYCAEHGAAGVEREVT